MFGEEKKIPVPTRMSKAFKQKYPRTEECRLQAVIAAECLCEVRAEWSRKNTFHCCLGFTQTWNTTISKVHKSCLEM